MNGPHKACTIWLTGLPDAGKSTIVCEVANRLRARGGRVEILDSDEIRRTINPDRDVDICNIGYIARLLTRNGVTTVVATPLPSRMDRGRNRALIGDFVEVHVKASAETTVDPFEGPLDPDVVCDAEEGPSESASKVILALERMGYLIPFTSSGDSEFVYSSADEAIVKQRLEDLGYL